MAEKIVEMNEYKKARAPHILRSSGLGPCICVGADYNKSGYMVHYPSGAYSLKFEKLLKDLKKDVKDKSLLKIYVAGGAEVPEDEESTEMVLDARKDCLEKIADAGFKPTEVRWNHPDTTQTLSLILDEGKAVYNQELDEISEYE